MIPAQRPGPLNDGKHLQAARPDEVLLIEIQAAGAARSNSAMDG